MNYEKLYFAFMEKYKSQVIGSGVYTEKHHIIPRHAGGDDSESNLVKLTYRQHVFAHRILWKAYGMSSDYHAWLMMSGQEVDSVVARRIARGKANVVSGHLERIREFANTAERKRKLSELNKFKVDSGLCYDYINIAQLVWTGSHHTEEWKASKSVQMKSWCASDEGKDHVTRMNKIAVKLKKDNSKKLSDDFLLNAERNEEFLQEVSSKSKNKFISPEGLEFDSPIYAASYYGNVKPHVIENWCKRGQHGWSRKPKTTQE